VTTHAVSTCSMLAPPFLLSRLQEIYADFRPEIRRQGLERSWHSYKFLLRELAPLVCPGNDYLDLGAGAGVIPLVLARCGLNVSVVDTWAQYDPQNKNRMGDTGEIMARFNRAGVHSIRWDMASCPLPLADECCDLLTFFDVLEHIPKPHALLKEAYRLLRPGGLLVIKVPNAANLRNRLRLLCGRSPHPDSIEDWFSDNFYGHYREMTASEFRHGIPPYGFEVQSLAYTSACQWNTRLSDGFDRSFRVNSVQQFAKLIYFGITAIVPSFRYEILLRARKADRIRFPQRSLDTMAG
jgi:SAM-dependent methyltransferase